MPVKRRIGRGRRQGWSAVHRMQLRTGWDYLKNAFGEGDAFDHEAARACWEELRDDILAEWDRPLSRPWAWWVFDRGIARPSGASRQRAYLAEHGLLTPAERAMVEADPSLLVVKTRGYDL
jgi:hypothetical protein